MDPGQNSALPQKHGTVSRYNSTFPFVMLMITRERLHAMSEAQVDDRLVRQLKFDPRMPQSLV